jgi:hypothetical protein
MEALIKASFANFTFYWPGKWPQQRKYSLASSVR